MCDKCQKLADDNPAEFVKKFLDLILQTVKHSAPNLDLQVVVATPTVSVAGGRGGKNPAQLRSLAAALLNTADDMDHCGFEVRADT